MIFIAKGHAYMGTSKMDENGNVVESTPARFEEASDGPCVAVGIMNSDTYEQEGAAEIFGDWQAAQFLARALELVNPARSVNIPDSRTSFTMPTTTELTYASIVRATAHDASTVL